MESRVQGLVSELLQGWDNGTFAKTRLGDDWVVQRRYGHPALAALDAPKGEAPPGRTRPLTMGIDLTALGPRLSLRRK